jgi:hypothetical protein
VSFDVPSGPPPSEPPHGGPPHDGPVEYLDSRGGDGTSPGPAGGGRRTTVIAVAASDADIAPTSHAVPLTNVYRDDVVRPGLSHEAALAGAPAAEDGRFRVPQILGEEQ